LPSCREYLALIPFGGKLIRSNSAGPVPRELLTLAPGSRFPASSLLPAEQIPNANRNWAWQHSIPPFDTTRRLLGDFESRPRKGESDTVVGLVNIAAELGTPTIIGKSLRDDAHAIEPVAWRQWIEFGGGVADPGHIAGEGIPVGRVQVRIELQPAGDVRDGSPGEQHVRARQSRR